MSMYCSTGLTNPPFFIIQKTVKSTFPKSFQNHSKIIPKYDEKYLSDKDKITFLRMIKKGWSVGKKRLSCHKM